jgi:hypothetical protein
MWEMKIPLSSVMIDRWRIEEESSRKQFAACENIGLGAGVIHEAGKAHHVVIPYIDAAEVSMIIIGQLNLRRNSNSSRNLQIC